MSPSLLFWRNAAQRVWIKVGTCGFALAAAGAGVGCGQGRAHRVRGLAPLGAAERPGARAGDFMIWVSQPCYRVASPRTAEVSGCRAGAAGLASGRPDREC